MNGRESRITRMALSKKRETILEKLRKSESIVGIEVSVDNKKYVITNGNIDKVTESVEKIKSRIIHEYCTE